MASTSNPDDRNPAVIAFSNAVWAVFVCTAINLFCSWGTDWINEWVGNPPVKKAPTWIGSLIVGGQTGWPAVSIATLCGLFGRNMSNLTPALVVIHLLGLIDPTAAFVVGIVLVLIQRTHQPDE
jgi:hypothetical protein